MILESDVGMPSALFRFVARFFVFLCLYCVSNYALATPLTERFEATVPPAGWSGFSMGVENGGWKRTDAPVSEYGYSATAPADYAISPISHWLITPPLRNNLHQSTLAFSIRRNSPQPLADDSVRVLLSRSENNPEFFTEMLWASGVSELHEDSFSVFVIDLAAFSTDTFQIAFVFEQVSESSAVVLDNVDGPSLALPIAPRSPVPMNGDSDVVTTAALSWTAGFGTIASDVYVSRSYDDIENLAESARIATGIDSQTFKPPWNFVPQSVYYWRVVEHGEDADAFGPVWTFATGIGPLSGLYSVGFNGDFESIGDAAAYVSAHGVTGVTEFAISPGIYSETVVIASIPGASEEARVTFRNVAPEEPVTIQRSGTTDTAAVILVNADYVTLDGISTSVSGGSLRHGIVLTAGSCDNIIRNCALRGPGSNLSGSYGILLRGTGIHRNRIENVSVRASQRGFNLESPAGSSGFGNRITQCRADSVRWGVYLLRQASCHVEACSLASNGGAYDEVDGIVVATTLPGDSIFLHENRIRQLTTSGAYAIGIKVRTDSAAAYVRAYNNTICDFRNTGSSQVRAIYITSGRCEFISNSIHVNDVAATGAAHAVYIGSLASNGPITLKNNIFSNTEATANAYGIFSFSMTAALTSDYNIFYGTGSGFRVGRYGSEYSTLSAWQNGTGKDAQSLAGNPGFISSTDLHLSAEAGLAHQNGLVVPFVDRDVDGEPRLIPPDRGADEYVFNAPPVDIALLGFAEPAESYPEYSEIPIRVVVHNRGSAEQRGVPIRLYCNSVLQDEVFISSQALNVDTISLNWITGGGDSTWTLSAACDADSDANAANDSISMTVEVVRPPLAGSFEIGSPESAYPDFSSAISDLAARGITEPVTLVILPGSYNEQITIPPIPGASTENTITFRRAPSRSVVNLTSSVGPAVVLLNGADHVIFEDVNIIATGDNNEAVRMTNGADSNRILNVALHGPSLLLTSAIGIHVVGGGNDDNEIRGVSLQGFCYGIRLEGSSTVSDHRNIVDQCTLFSARTGIRTDYQDSTRISGNIIHTGYDGAAVACQGISLQAGAAGTTVFVEGNQFVGGRGESSLCGIYSNTGSAAAAITSNAFCGWSTTGTGTVWGILAGSGQAKIHFNSFWMNDIAGSGDVIAIADTGAAITALNNAIQITERTNPSWCFYRTAGTLNSDYSAFRDFSSINPQFGIGRSGMVNYTTLSQWQTATGLDENSITGDPGFMDSLNLHIQAHIPLLNGRGISISGLNYDMDMEYRENPPDIGADEFMFGIHENNFMIQWHTTPVSHYNELTEYELHVLVRNIGSEAHGGVPVRLFYKNAVVGERFVNLQPSEMVTTTLVWFTPDVDLDIGALKAQVCLENDDMPQNDSVSVQATVIGQPMEGSYACGGSDSDFDGLAECVQHLLLRGVSGSVNILIQDGVYNDAVDVTAIPGQSAGSPVTFRGTGATPSATVLTANQGEAIVRLEGVTDVSFENMSFVCTGTCTLGVFLLAGASRNTFQDCVIRGIDSSSSSTVGIRLKTDACDSNFFERIDISGVFQGVIFQGGSSGSKGVGNTIRRCTIRHPRYGIYVSRQTDCLIESNDIQPGSISDLAAACYGIYVTTLGTGGSVRIGGNRIHDFADHSFSVSNRAVGIFAAPAAGASVLAYNNFIYGFQDVLRLKINAIYLSSGLNSVLHNSILIDDAPTTNEIAAIYVSTGSGHIIKNNIIVSRETGSENFGVLQVGGTSLVCDGNDIWGMSPSFLHGKIYGVPYPALAQWQSAGFDLNGMSADPFFTSDHDLHIIDTMDVVDGRGVYVAEVTTDFDRELRGNPPDIGADEYAVLGPPPTPQNMTILVDLAGQIRLFWNSSPGAASYHVYRDTVPEFLPTVEKQQTITADTFFVLDVDPDTLVRWFYCVTADRRPVPVHLSTQLTPQFPPPAAVLRD